MIPWPPRFAVRLRVTVLVSILGTTLVGFAFAARWHLERHEREVALFQEEFLTEAKEEVLIGAETFMELLACWRTSGLAWRELIEASDPYHRRIQIFDREGQRIRVGPHAAPEMQLLDAADFLRLRKQYQMEGATDARELRDNFERSRPGPVGEANPPAPAVVSYRFTADGEYLVGYGKVVQAGQARLLALRASFERDLWIALAGTTLFALVVGGICSFFLLRSLDRRVIQPLRGVRRGMAKLLPDAERAQLEAPERGLETVVEALGGISARFASTQADLDSSEAEREAILQAIDAAIFAIDDTGRVRWLNRHAAALLPSRDSWWGAAFDDLTALETGSGRPLGLGRAVVDALTGPGAVVLPSEAFLVGEGSKGKREFRIAHGRITRGEMAGHGMVVALRDVTEERTWQRATEHDDKLKAVGLLAGAIAHDLNNSLQAIMGHAELGANVSDTAQIAEHFSEIEEACARSSSLTRRILAFSRRLPARERAVDLAAVVRGITPTLSRLLRESIALEVQLPDAPLGVLADPSQIEQVLMNLVLNSQDASPLGGRITVALTPDANAQLACLSVRDEGEGMTPEVLERACEPFFTTKGEGKGTGLGLFVVREIIETAGGSLALESAPGRGTTAEASWPLRKAPKTSATSEGQGSESADHRGLIARLARERVLICEDDTAVRETLESALVGLGIAALTSARPSEAKLKAASFSPTVLVTDIGLEEAGGVALAHHLRSGNAHLHVVFITGYGLARPELPGAAARLLRKPFAIDDLLAVLDDLVRVD